MAGGGGQFVLTREMSGKEVEHNKFVDYSDSF